MMHFMEDSPSTSPFLVRCTAMVSTNLLALLVKVGMSFLMAGTENTSMFKIRSDYHIRVQEKKKLQEKERYTYCSILLDEGDVCDPRRMAVRHQ